ncbi:MAG: hypothetical protein AAF394_00265 [Planctomycetota bacterium]
MQEGDRCIVVVADGAGGSGSGDAAAEMVVQQIKSHYKAVHSADDLGRPAWRDRSAYRSR